MDRFRCSLFSSHDLASLFGSWKKHTPCSSQAFSQTIQIQWNQAKFPRYCSCSRLERQYAAILVYPWQKSQKFEIIFIIENFNVYLQKSYFFLDLKFKNQCFFMNKKCLGYFSLFPCFYFSLKASRNNKTKHTDETMLFYFHQSFGTIEESPACWISIASWSSSSEFGTKKGMEKSLNEFKFHQRLRLFRGRVIARIL